MAAEGVPSWSTAVTLQVGQLVITNDRVWRVTLVNFTRARLDPITRSMTERTGWEPIDVAPTSMLDSGEDYDFDPPDLQRLIELLEDAEFQEVLDEERRLVAENRRIDALEAERVARFYGTVAHSAVFADEYDNITFDKGEIIMAVAEAPGVKKTAGQLIKEKNAARLAAIKDKKDAAAKAKGAEKAAKPAREKKEKAPKEPKPCQCGCGGETNGYFVPGHDARFKGKLLKVEKGDAKKEDELDAAVIAKYKWIPSGYEGKAGKGQKPTTNYKGEPHSGYVVDRDAAPE